MVNPKNQQKGLLYKRYTDRRYTDRRYTDRRYTDRRITSRRYADRKDYYTEALGTIQYLK